MCRQPDEETNCRHKVGHGPWVPPSEQSSPSSLVRTYSGMQPALPTVDKDRVCVPDTILRPATKPANATTAPAGSTTDVETAAVAATAMTTHYPCHWNEEQPTHPTTTTTTPTTTTTNTTTPASTTTTNTTGTTTTTTATTTTSTAQSYLAPTVSEKLSHSKLIQAKLSNQSACLACRVDPVDLVVKSSAVHSPGALVFKASS